MTAQPRQLPVAQPLPADWREQAERRRSQDAQEALERRDRDLAARCPHFLTKRRHVLVPDATPTYMHLAGKLDVFTMERCTGRIPNVTRLGTNHLRCPVFEIEGERYPTRPVRLRRGPHRKRLLYRGNQ